MSIFLQVFLLKVEDVRVFKKTENSLLLVRQLLKKDENPEASTFLDEYILNKENNWFLNRRFRLDIDASYFLEQISELNVQLTSDYLFITSGEKLYAFRHSILSVFLEEAKNLLTVINITEMHRVIIPIPLSDQIYENYFYTVNKNQTLSIYTLSTLIPPLSCDFEGLSKALPNFDSDKRFILKIESFERTCPRKRLSNDTSIYNTCLVQKSFSINFVIDDLQESYLYIGMFIGLTVLLIISVVVFLLYRKLNKKYLVLSDPSQRIQVRNPEEFREQAQSVLPNSNEPILNAVNGPTKDPTKDTPRFSVDEQRGGESNGLNHESIEDIYNNI